MNPLSQDLSDITFEVEKENKQEGRYVVQPLITGYGHTLGNSLRRVLLSGLSGAAITQVKIVGVRHQFSTIKGVSEDVVEITLNLKQVRLRLEDKDEATLRLSVSKAGEVTAGDFETPPGVTIVNPKLHLATLAGKNPKLTIEAKVEKGWGYRLAEEAVGEEIGLIKVDALFTPIKRVNHIVEPIRVGRYANYDRLILEVITDGTITPGDAIKEAAKVLIDYFGILVNPQPKTKESAGSREHLSVDQTKLDRMSLEELDLPTRLINSLRRGGIETVADLVGRRSGQIAEIPNIGEKSVQMIVEVLSKQGLKFKGD